MGFALIVPILFFALLAQFGYQITRIIKEGDDRKEGPGFVRSLGGLGLIATFGIVTYLLVAVIYSFAFCEGSSYCQGNAPILVIYMFGTPIVAGVYLVSEMLFLIGAKSPDANEP